MTQYIVPRQRIEWTHSYLLDALYWSTRSHDVHTQCGCVLAAPDMTPISHGYNGFIDGVADEELPRTRPDKLAFMIHSEHNAILNAVRQGQSTMNAYAFITCEPCTDCLQYMWRAGIRNIYFSNFSSPKMMDNDTQRRNKKKLLELMKRADPYFRYTFIPAKDISSLPLEEIKSKFEKAKNLDG